MIADIEAKKSLIEKFAFTDPDGTGIICIIFFHKILF